VRKISLIILFCIFTILLINSIYAEEPEIRFTSKQGQFLDIFETCNDPNNKGLACDNFECNITITDPDQFIIVLNKLMTQNETNYNYTLHFNHSDVLGIYKDEVCCNNETAGGCKTFYHKVTPSGRDLKISDSIIYIIVLVGSLGIFILCAGTAIILPWDHKRNDEGVIIQINTKKYLKVLFGFTSYFLLIWVMNILVAITNNFLFLDISFNFFRTIYMILLFSIMPVLALGVLWAVISAINDKKLQQFLKRGIRAT